MSIQFIQLSPQCRCVVTKAGQPPNQPSTHGGSMASMEGWLLSLLQNTHSQRYFGAMGSKISFLLLTCHTYHVNILLMLVILHSRYEHYS